MNKILEKKLYDKYPNLFIQKDWPKTETCMCWGINADDGWYSIINNLCECINNYQLSCNYNLSPEDKNYYNVQFSQIKTKFGELRIYIDDNQNDSYIKGLITFAETMANKICVRCGHPATKKINVNHDNSFPQNLNFKPAICIKCEGENKT